MSSFETWNTASAVLGRRQTLKYAALGVFGLVGSAMVSACGSQADAGSTGQTDGGAPPGGGTSVANVALAAFVTGTWEVTFPLARPEDDRKPITLDVTKGAWRSTSEIKPYNGSGAWAYAAGRLQVLGWRGDDNTGTAQAPESFSEPSPPSTIPWEWDPGHTQPTSLALPVKWDSRTQTLTITGKDADGGELIIQARKKS